MTITLIILGLIVALVGIIGCILPVIPGPPLSYASLFILSIAKNWEPFNMTFLIFMGVVLVAVLLVDYIFPAIGARRYGASRTGVWCALIGMLVGIFFIPPWGMFIGAFAGAVIGELAFGKKAKEALKAGWGIFVGTMAGIGVKLAFCGAVLFFYVKALW
ncbi:MAG: hypothetical protein A2Z19_00895 [Deltaproteobacteria bacterium RBG_16_54_18]|nr:MAG: hypothetical protein A2Z19_00895 [Deltaproteobacteria bacterium RBG_16_54_18]